MNADASRTTIWDEDHPNVKAHVDTTLDDLRRDLAEHGDRVQMFVPYIPLVFIGGPIPEGCVPYGGGYAHEADVHRAERENARPERAVRTSDMIRTLTRLNRLLTDVTND